MDNPISMISEDNSMRLTFHKNNRHRQVKLVELGSDYAIFNKTCDTFITGDFILHLRKGIKRFKENPKAIKIVLSRWFTKIDPVTILPTKEYPYISTVLENRKEKYIAQFKVYLSEKECYTFETDMSNIEHFTGKQ